MSETAEPELRILIRDSLLRRLWVCGVVRSGYHNGAGCNPRDECHDPSWGCGWRFELSVSDTPQNRVRLGITDEIAERL